MTRFSARQLRGFVVVMALMVIPVSAYWTAVIVAQTEQPPVSVPTVEVPGLPMEPPAENISIQPAVPTKEVPSPAAPSNTQEQVAWGLGAAYVLEWLKRSGWFTFLTESSTQRVKAIFGFLSAFLTAAGIQFVVSGSVLDAGGASVSFTGITLIGIKDILFQWIAQQGWYDLIVHKRSAASVLERGAV